MPNLLAWKGEEKGGGRGTTFGVEIRGSPRRVAPRDRAIFRPKA